MSDEGQKPKGPLKTAAELKYHYLQLLRKGLGKDDLSVDEQRMAEIEVTDACSDIFMLYAKVEMARSLGILPWLLAAMTGEASSRGSDGQPL